MKIKIVYFLLLLFVGCARTQLGETGIPGAPVISDEKVQEEAITTKDMLGPPEPFGPEAPTASTDVVDLPAITESRGDSPAIMAPKLCIILGPGLVRGFAHAGVLEVFAKAKLPLDCIYGSEMGAIVAGLHAYWNSTNSLQWELFKITQDQYLNRPMLSLRSNGLGSAKKMRQFFSSQIGERKIADLKLPYHGFYSSTKTEGVRRIESSVSLSDALSIAMTTPGIYEPWQLNGEKVFSSVLLEPLPIQQAKEAGATVLVVVNVLGKSIIDTGSHGSVYSKVFSNIKTQVELQKTGATILLEPDTAEIALDDFSKKIDAVATGRDAAEEQIEKIKSIWDQEQVRFQCESNPAECDKVKD